MIIKKILVPLDFSEFSEKALEYAIELAEKFEAALTLFHAVLLFQDDIGEEQRLQEYENWIKKRENRLINQMENSRQKAARRGIDVQTIMIRGISSADVILDHVNDNPFDLIVMGTHGRSGLKHILQGSVAEKVVRMSPVPVLTIHRSVTQFQVNKILVPLDFSFNCKDATDYALSLAKKFKSTLEFIHIIEQDIHPSFYASGVDSIFQIDTGLKERVIENMKGFLADQLPPELTANFVVKEGKAHKEIVEHAKENGIDMIVIATHGLTGLDYILLGSTTEKVVRWANCPVFTVRRKKESS
ncbi:MAG: universal stress protein [Calditrichia bacterium]